jgi:hypothetical protein
MIFFHPGLASPVICREDTLIMSNQNDGPTTWSPNMTIFGVFLWFYTTILVEFYHIRQQSMDEFEKLFPVFHDVFAFMAIKENSFFNVSPSKTQFD